MTKRYLNVLTTGDIKDTVTGELIRGSGIGDLLNQLNEENEQLKSSDTITDLETKIMKLKEENEHIKQTIKDMINTERTEIGQSVLRQLWEAIQ